MKVLKCTHALSGINHSIKLVAAIVAVVVTEKPETHFPGPAIRAMLNLWLECSARGTPPIQITINQNGKQMVKGTGFVKKLIEDEGENRWTGRNETGTDSKEICLFSHKQV